MPDTLDLDARYSVASSPGIAFYLLGYAKEMTEERYEFDCIDPEAHPDDDDHSSACYVYNEPEEIENTDMVRAVMVGDDRVHIIDVSELTEISDEDYCSSCGQLGCTADGR